MIVVFLVKHAGPTDKLVLHDCPPYCKTFFKRRVSMATYKEMNLNVGYSEHPQRGVSINLPKETNDSKQKKENKEDFNIKERTEQSEMVNKTSVNCAEDGSFYISDSKDKKETNHLKQFHKSRRIKFVQRNVCCEIWPNTNINVTLAAK